MDTKDSNIKPQQTGGLKLMTVFIAVLALHVLVIGGITVYHLMSGGSTDADLTSTDKAHKNPAMADSLVPDAAGNDKNIPAPPEVTTTPANSPAPPPAPTSPVEMAATASPPNPVAPSPASTPNPAPLMPPPLSEASNPPSGPISSELLPPPDSTASTAVSGPVHMPPAMKSMPASQQTYTVKITDSYKKIAHAHHITVAQLKEANHIKGDVLHAGQKLVIPSKTLVAATSSGPLLESSGTGSLMSDSATGSTATLTTMTSTMSPTASYNRTYTVVKGDTLARIAHKFKTTSTALMSENSISDPTKLPIGKKLKIPSRESRSARNGAPSSSQPGQVQSKENAPSGRLANFVP